MARRRRRRRRGGGWIKTAAWVALAAVAAVAVIGAIVFFYLNQPEDTDERLCPAKSGPAAGLAVLLDLTDSLNRVQLASLREVLDRRIDDAAPNTLIAVGAVRSDAEERGPEFTSCKPMEGGQANEFYENPGMIEKRYQKKFRQPLDAILAGMLNRRPADSSPIMESLQALLVGTPGFVDAKYPRRVIIVSDLLQHSAAFSFYRRDTWRRFVGSPNAQRLAGRLNDVAVEICRVPRPGAPVNLAEVDDFWVRYMDRAGANRLLTSTCRLGDL